MTKEQEAALDKLAQASVTNVVQQVRDLGHYPKASLGRSPAERQLAWKLRTVVIAKQFSPEQEAELQALRLVQQVRDLGRYPKENAGRSLAERQLAENLRRALKAKRFSPEQEAELQALRQASPKQEDSVRRAEDSARRAEELMQQVRDIGRYPKESRRGSTETQLAERIRRARKAKQFSPKQEAELQALQQEPRSARARGGEASPGNRRRPAARNAEEDRRLSRRTDAA